MLTTCLWILAALALLYAAFQCFLIYHTWRVSRRWSKVPPRARVIGEQDAAITDAIRAAINIHEPIMESLGLRRRGLLHIPMNDQVSFVILAMTDEAGATDAWLTLMHYAGLASRGPGAMYEFETTFADGARIRCVQTHRLDIAESSPLTRTHGFAILRDPGALLWAHRGLTMRHASPPVRGSVAQGAYGEAATREEWRSHNDLLERRNIEADPSGLMYRFTRKAILTGIFRLLGPAGSIRRMRANDRARQLLGELGLPPSVLRSAAVWGPGKPVTIPPIPPPVPPPMPNQSD